MYKWYKTLILVALLSLPYSFAQNNADDQKSIIIYYQAESDLIKINLADKSFTKILSNIGSPIQFSPDRTMLAFQDDLGVWLSNLSDLKFQNIATDAISLPNFGAPFWTPDSQSLIFSYANRVAQGDTPEKVQSYIYNSKLGNLSAWDWDACTSIVRNLTSYRFALKCSSISSISSPDIRSIALQWGSHQTAFVDSNYEVLLDRINFPKNYDWHRTDEGEQVVYIRNGVPAEIYLVEGAKKPESFDLADDYSIVSNIISVSPDYSEVAYIVECNNRGPKACLQISNIATRKIVWNYQDTISVSSAWNLQWSLNSQYVVLLGVNGTTDSLISVFDVKTGLSTKFPVKNATGNLMVSSM